MSAKRELFPLQSRPLYRFQIIDSNLVRTEHARYDIWNRHQAREITYRIPDEHGMKTKAESQLDHVLNNSLWTFEPDFHSALEKFRQRAEADEIMAATMLETAHSLRSDVAAIQANGAFITTGGSEA